MDSHKSSLEEWADTESRFYLLYLHFAAEAVQVGQTDLIKVVSGCRMGALPYLLMATSPSLSAPADGSDSA